MAYVIVGLLLAADAALVALGLWALARRAR